MSKRSTFPIRILTAVPICDGHDSAINTINVELVRHGIEVIYLGYHRPARDIVRAAIQEDVRAVGLSSYNGGHVEFFTQVVAGLRAGGAGQIGLFGGGGGTISPADARAMARRGVDRIFFAGTSLDEIAAYVRERYATAADESGKPTGASLSADRRLAMQITAAEQTTGRGAAPRRAGRRPLTIGVTGPGGAGKTTLIDELVLRFLRARPDGRIAILSHDPSAIGSGALLGDRAAMIHAQNDRVFMRSLAARGRAGGLAPATGRCLAAIHAAREEPFDLVVVETVGVGQEASPFSPGLVDRSIFVTSPDYGSRLQLQKIVMLDAADIVVINKAELPGAAAARSEIEQRLAQNGRGQRLVSTIAKNHRDAGVDELMGLLNG